MPTDAWSYASGTSDVPLLGLTIGDLFDWAATQYADNVTRTTGLGSAAARRAITPACAQPAGPGRGDPASEERGVRTARSGAN